MNNLPVSKIVKKQVIRKLVNGFRVDGGTGKLVIKIRYDDEYGNGHNTFSITGTLYRDDRELASGCIHDDIETFAPEYAHLIKWHLTSSDEPMHYVSNTMYHASTKDCFGREAGEPYCFENSYLFGNSPISYTPNSNLKKVIDKIGIHGDWNLKVIPIEYAGTISDFSPKYTLEGHECEWHYCPFDSEQAASEFIEAMMGDVKVISRPTAFGKGKTPDIEAARMSAVWPDATLEQLQDEEQLKARLPALMNEFKSVIESLGMEY